MARLSAHPDRDAGPQGLERLPVRSWFRKLPGLLMLPREHGAWAMLLMPYLLGTLVAGWGGWPSFLLIVSLLLLFTASRPLELAMRDRTNGSLVHAAVYLGIGGAAGTLLLAGYQRWMLVPVAVFAVVALGSQLLLRRRRLDRTWPARLISIAALSATGPAAYYASTGIVGRVSLALWVISFLYSGASVFFVRLSYRPPSKQQEDGRRQAEKQIAAYLDATVAVMLVMVVAGWFPPLGLVALVPLMVKVALAWRRRDSRPSLKQIGMTEIVHSALFVALAAAAFSFWK